MITKKTKRILAVAAAVIVALFVTVQIINYASRQEFQTEIANKFEVNFAFTGDAFIIRDEAYVYNETQGVLSYKLTDGGKVNKGGVVASVFDNEQDAAANKEIARIDSEIADLNLLKQAAESADYGIDSIGSGLNTKMLELIESINQKDYNSVDERLNDMVFSLTERQILTASSGMDLQAKIDALTAQKGEYATQAAANANCTASKAGYFSSTVDGYEVDFATVKDELGLEFNDDSIKSITPQQIEKLKQKKAPPQNAIGKVVMGLNWYMICSLTNEQTLNLAASAKTGDLLTVDLPFAIGQSISAELLEVYRSADGNGNYAVLKCNYYDSKTVSIRFEEANISTQVYSGLRVSKQALHDDYVTGTDNKRHRVQGVYTLYGNYLIFKQVDIMYAGADFVLCNPTPQKGKMYAETTVELYDEVVTKGDDLYDRKVVR